MAEKQRDEAGEGDGLQSIFERLLGRIEQAASGMATRLPGYTPRWVPPPPPGSPPGTGSGSGAGGPRGPAAPGDGPVGDRREPPRDGGRPWHSSPLANLRHGKPGSGGGDFGRDFQNFAPAPVAAGFATALQKTRGWSDIDDMLQRLARRMKDDGGSTFGISVARGGVGVAASGAFGIFAAVEGIKYFADKIDRSYQFQAQAIAPFNGAMMASNASLRLGDFDRARRMGLAVSGSFSDMTDALNVFRERTQPIRETLTNLGNKAGAGGLGFSGAFLDDLWNRGLPNPFSGLFGTPSRFAPGKEWGGMIQDRAVGDGKFWQAPLANLGFGAWDAMQGALRNGLFGDGNNGLSPIPLFGKGSGKWVADKLDQHVPFMKDGGFMRGWFESTQDRVADFLKTQAARLSPGAYSAGMYAGSQGQYGFNDKGLVGFEGFKEAFSDAAGLHAADEKRAEARMGEMWNDIRAMASGQVGMKSPLNPMLGEGAGGAVGAVAFVGAGGGGGGATAGNQYGVSPAQMAAFRRRDPRIGADGRWRPTPGSALANSNTIGPEGLPVGRDGRPRRNVGVFKDNAVRNGEVPAPGAGQPRQAAMIAPERIQDPDEQLGPRHWGGGGKQLGSAGFF